MRRATMNVKIDIHRLQQLWDIERSAGALVESMHTHICNGNFSQTVTMTGSEPTAVSKKALDALARAVDAGKERG